MVSLFELMIVKPCGRELWKGVGRKFGNRKERDMQGRSRGGKEKRDSCACPYHVFVNAHVTIYHCLLPTVDTQVCHVIVAWTCVRYYSCYQNGPLIYMTCVYIKIGLDVMQSHPLHRTHQLIA